METKVQISVFVSGPSDVQNEKEIVKSVCQAINESSENYCKFIFTVKDWSTVVGKMGERPQQTINVSIGSYDIYIGIWWMRFGSPTGALNPQTGTEFESGTQEEYVQAVQSFKLNQYPDVHLFFKKYRCPATDEVEQLHKLNQFRLQEEQQRTGLLNNFETSDEFHNKVLKLLNERLLKLCLEQKKAHEKEIDLDSHRFSNPAGYVPRIILSLEDIQKKHAFISHQPKNLLDLVGSEKKIIVLGDAGSGKSYELKRLAFLLENGDKPWIPFYYSLNLYTGNNSIESFLQIDPARLDTNLVIIILDGLDEVQPNDFSTFTRQLLAFAANFPEIRIILSCRTNFYDSPDSKTPGTLPDFKAFYISDFAGAEVEQFFTLNFPDRNSSKFLEEMHKNHFDDLVKKPFFLLLLAQAFDGTSHGPLSRAQLFKDFIDSRILLDKTHFKTTIDLEFKQKEVLSVLRKTALTLEMLSRNQIDEDSLLEILNPEQLRTLKYCTAFKRVEGTKDLWQFEHNNIQEYLAAKAISNSSYEQVINLITVPPKHKKFNSSWINTLTFLFTIADEQGELSSSLLRWLTEHEPELIVRFEREKLSETFRFQVFKKVFDYYKLYDIWLRSNKFSHKDLAYFAPSDSAFDFLFSELSGASKRTSKINSLRIIGHLQLTNAHSDKLFDLARDLITSNPTDYFLIYSVLQCLTDAEINSKKVIESLMEQLADNQNEYVRAGIYSLLKGSACLDDYVDYLLDGLNVPQGHSERGEVHLFDEDWNLRLALSSIKRPDAIAHLADYLASNIDQIFPLFSHKELWSAIVENAVNAYNNNNVIFHHMFRLLAKLAGRDKNILAWLMVFFDKTNNIRAAIHQSYQLQSPEREYLVAILMRPQSMPQVIDDYLEGLIARESLVKIHTHLLWENNILAQPFAQQLTERLQIVFEKPLKTDYNSNREKRLKRAFNLLFDPDKFIQTALQIFSDLDRNELTTNELYATRAINGHIQEAEERYPTASLRFLNSLAHNGTVTASRIKNFTRSTKNLELYLVSQIQEYLQHNKDLQPSHNQLQWIKEWTTRAAQAVNFRTALSVNPDGSLNTSRKAYIAAFFQKRFDISLNTPILLDMLSFDFVDGYEWSGIDHIIKLIPADLSNNRITENLQNAMLPDPVLKSNVKHALKNQLEKTYPNILSEIINPTRRVSARIEILHQYYDSTHNPNDIFQLFALADQEIKWTIAEMLEESSSQIQLEYALLELLQSEKDHETRFRICKHLLKLQNKTGLEEYIALVKLDDKLPVASSDFSKISKVEFISLLIQLLFTGYERPTDKTQFESLTNIALGVLQKIAFTSEAAFESVDHELMDFYRQNQGKLDGVNYLIPFLNDLRDKFYVTKSSLTTIDQVSEKLRTLGIE